MGDAEDEALEAARQRRIADACLVAFGDAGGRLGLYRRLIQGNLAAIARRLLPRTAMALDASLPRAFDAWFARFLAESGPRTPYLRDVPVELVAWAEALWRSSSETPPFVPDLARHEIDLFQIESAPKPVSQPPFADVALDRPLVFATPRKLAHYAYAVNESLAVLPQRETHLFLHRDAENTVHATPLDDYESRLLTLALDGAPLGEALAKTASKRSDSPLDVQGVARWLAALGENGALLGGLG